MTENAELENDGRNIRELEKNDSAAHPGGYSTVLTVLPDLDLILSYF